MEYTLDSKVKFTTILLAVLSILSLVTAATFGYLYFREKAKYDQLKGQTSNVDKGSTNDNDADNKGENNSTDNNTQQPQNTEPKTLTKDFDCPQWMYASTSTKVPHMYIVYKESANVSFENVNKKCEDIVMKYKNAKLYLTYSYGEAYATLLDKKGTEVITLKTAQKVVNGNNVTYTLARQKYTKTEPASTSSPAGYWLNYVNLQSKASCEAYDEMAGAVVGYPCFVGANPFVTPAGRFDLYFPLGTSSEDIIEAVQYFDNVAKDSSYKEL